MQQKEFVMLELNTFLSPSTKFMFLFAKTGIVETPWMTRHVSFNVKFLTRHGSILKKISALKYFILRRIYVSAIYNKLFCVCETPSPRVPNFVSIVSMVHNILSSFH